MTDEITSEDQKYLFTTTDCMGKSVSLKHGTFSYKILKDHPELTTDIIKEGIESAHIVAPDTNKYDRYRYYKMITHPVESKNNLTHIKVVTEDTKRGNAEVVTAYLVTDLRNEIIRGGIIYDAGSASKS